MQSNRHQRREFIKNAKKQWKKGLMSKEQFSQLKKEINDMGKEQHLQHVEEIRANQGIKTLSEDNIDELIDAAEDADLLDELD